MASLFEVRRRVLGTESLKETNLRLAPIIVTQAKEAFVSEKNGLDILTISILVVNIWLI